MNKQLLDLKTQLDKIYNAIIQEINNTSSQMVQVYIDAQRGSNIKIGDKVCVINKAFSYQAGWQNEWIINMDDYVGKVGKVIEIYEHPYRSSGITVSFENNVSFIFPYFVLKKIEDTKEVKKEDEEEFHVYQQVLVRDHDNDEWIPNIFLRKKDTSDRKSYYEVMDSYYAQCIPYKGNEELAWSTRKPCK